MPAEHTDHHHERQLRSMVSGSDVFMAMLRQVRQLALADWCIGAGAVRSLVWDRLHGIEPWRLPPDIDVCYFDAGDLSAAGEAAHLARLQQLAPQVPWEVANQARVHLWYAQQFGFAVAPLDSLAAGVASWPEYATCVGVCLDAEDQIGIIAPLGLEDLFSLTVRHNPVRASAAAYRQRVAAKNYTQRWPQVTVITE